MLLYRALHRALPDAGTLLSFDPVSARDDYEINDLDFRRTCCDQNGGCEMFLERRPINMGTNYSEPSMCMNELKNTVLYNNMLTRLPQPPE